MNFLNSSLNTIPKMLPIAKIIPETPHVKTFVFRCGFAVKPGQFVNIWVPRVDEKPMSVALSTGKELWLTVFAVGGMTKKLHEMKVGDFVGIRGPFGTHFAYNPGDHLVLLGGGYGAAPLYFLAREAVKKNCTVDFIVGARGKDYLLFLNRIRKLGKNVKLHIATDDGSVGEKGYNTQILEKVLAEIQKDKRKLRRAICVAVGPELMMKRASDLCFAKKVTCQVSIERYMKCGFGVCGSCCVDESGERMCMEGPVVDHLRARKMKDFGVYHRDKVGRKVRF